MTDLLQISEDIFNALSEPDAGVVFIHQRLASKKPAILENVVEVRHTTNTDQAVGLVTWYANDYVDEKVQRDLLTLTRLSIRYRGMTEVISRALELERALEFGEYAAPCLHCDEEADPESGEYCLKHLDA